MIKSSSLSSATSSTWSLCLPPQYALLLSNLLVLTNFITALLVPWVEARYKIIDAWFPIYVPVKIGLLKCFSEVCSALTDAQNQSHDHKGKKGSNDNSPPPIPGWGPTGGGGGGAGAPVGGGGGGAKVLFEVAAIFGVILLSIATLLALGGALLEAARLQGRQDISGLIPLQLSTASALICLIALLQYLFITLGGLHGGHYEVGFWLTLGTAVVTGVLCLGQYLLNKSFFDEEHGDGNGGRGFFLPSSFGAPKQRGGGGGGERSACAKGCCGGGGGGGGGQATLVQPRPNYGAV